MLKYIFMGSPAFAAQALQTLCEAVHPPLAVVTQTAKATGRGQVMTTTAVGTLARSLGLTVIETDNVNAPETVAALSRLEPDLVLVVAFGQILREAILGLPKRYCLNVHASLLPEYRGAAPIQRAIAEGKAETGITIQKMARKLDTGDILLQKKLPIDPADTSTTLFEKLATLGGECLVDAVRLIEKHQEKFVAQNENQATYAAKLDKAEAELNWNLPAKTLLDQIRAFQPWPIAESKLGGTKLRVFKAEVIDAAGKGSPGKILTDSKSYIAVICGDAQALSLTEIQLDNRKKLNVKEFLMAYRGAFPHTKMGS